MFTNIPEHAVNNCSYMYGVHGSWMNASDPHSSSITSKIMMYVQRTLEGFSFKTTGSGPPIADYSCLQLHGSFVSICASIRATKIAPFSTENYSINLCRPATAISQAWANPLKLKYTSIPATPPSYLFICLFKINDRRTRMPLVLSEEHKRQIYTPYGNVRKKQ